jgi:hypothetical protein
MAGVAGNAMAVPGGGLGQKGGGQTQVGFNTPGRSVGDQLNQLQPGMAAPAAAPPQNVYQQSAGAYTNALQGAQGAMNYRPQQVGSQNISSQNAVGGMAQYQNPYTQQVINTSMADLERQRQMQMNDLGAQATAARAFGGSRQGVAEALTNEGFARQGGQLSSQLYNQGFQTALGASQSDQQRQLQAQQANQQAALQAAMANQQAEAQAAQQQLAAASQLGNLSNLGFGFGQQIGATQTQQGQAQQMMNQALIDAAKGQYGGFTGAPQQSLGLPMAALSGANMGQQTQTTTSKPGLFDYLTAGASLFCWVAREVYGEEDDRWIQFRTWLLNDAPKWLLNLYAKHGEWFAGIVRKAPILKRALRPLMDRARRAAGFVE